MHLPHLAGKPPLGLAAGAVTLFATHSALLFAQPKPATQIRFEPAIHLPAGSHPQTVLIADVNRDGKNDIIVGNNGSSNLSVYLGDGKGAFTPAPGSPFAAGPSPNDLAIGDFNGDGNLDVAIANHGVKLVTVLLGDGRGRFAMAPGSPFAVASNPHPHGIVAADFNGDGKLDLAVDSWAENKLLVLFGNGDGTFRAPGEKLATGRMPYQRLRTADLNGDGHPDLITSNMRDASVSILLGNGKGGFSHANGTQLTVAPSPFGIAVGDFNGDHHLDLAIVHYSGQLTDPSQNGLSVLYGTGDGTFHPDRGNPFRVGHYPPTLAVGDLNGDGLDDVAIPNHVDNTLTIYLGGRDGIHAAAGSPFPVGRGPQCAAIGDLNGDGKADIVVADAEDDDLMLLFQK